MQITGHIFQQMTETNTGGIQIFCFRKLLRENISVKHILLSLFFVVTLVFCTELLYILSSEMQVFPVLSVVATHRSKNRT